MKGYTLLGVLMLLVSTVDSQYIFTLPPKSGFQSGMCYIENGTYYRLFANRVKKETYIEAYNLQTGKLSNSHTITGLSDAQAFYRVSDNEYWLFDESKAAFTLAKNGKIISQTSVFDGTKLVSGYYHYFIDMAHNPLHYYRGKLYSINALYRVAGEDVQRTRAKEFIYVMAESEQKSQTVAPIPSTLFSKDFGLINRFTSLRRNHILVIAPMYSNEIMLYNLDNGNLVYPVVDKSNPYYQVSKPLFEKDNFRTDRLSQQMLDEKMNEHFMSTDRYIAIYYDPFRKVYYRVLLQRKAENKKKTSLKIIVLDEYFKFLKAQDLDSKYLHYGMFVTEKGLNVFNHEAYLANNNRLTFDTFSLW